MCEPVSAGLAVAGLTAMAVGGVQKANSEKRAGKAQQQYYDYLAEQNEIEAASAEAVGQRNATMAQDAGSRELSKLKRGVMQFAATQIATGAANGIGGGSVTTADIAGDTFDKAKLDELTIRFNADSQAAEALDAGKYKAWDLRNQKTMNKISGKNASVAGKEAAKATLWNTAGSVLTAAAGLGVGNGTKSPKATKIS